MPVSLGLASGCQSQNVIADAAGPDTFTFEELLRLLASAVNARVRLVHTPTSLGFALTRLVDLLLRDLLLTRDGNCPAGALRRSPCPGSSPA